jgi:hypothetical protein
MGRLGRTVESPRKFDDLRGQINVWPILALDGPALAAEIARGDHDAYLTDLALLDRAQSARAVVQDAIRARRG